ncbi:MAG: DUF3473 domain-containing protein [Nitrospiraceae bacterium]|nr:DUF3473 domain-containing protein [Nitrospiraceae bacterium]
MMSRVPMASDLGPLTHDLPFQQLARLIPIGVAADLVATRWGFSRLNTFEQRPGMFYLHPWEIDPDQPRLGAGRLSRFRHYRNLPSLQAYVKRIEERLKPVTHNPRFDPLDQLPKIAGEAGQLGAADHLGRCRDVVVRRQETTASPP